ncbi:ABC transporter ATP-binding protein [Dactylosporangium sp. CA-092794]|uniref:ABC transporter ATP-binding protein n=1 Tax=Dactylosporangium sp. CA-092794 TaxID=3239929 RepID=UPI003D8B6DB5
MTDIDAPEAATGRTAAHGQLAPGVPLALDATAVCVSFRGHRGRWSRVVDRVGLGLERGQVTVLIGESGSGKTVFARTVAGLPPRGARVTGNAVFDGMNLLALHRRRLRAVHGDRIGMVPQDPNSSLDPMRRVGAQIVETIVQHRAAPDRAAARARMLELLELVQIRDPVRVAHRYPHELSGGMRQRVAIAIAICCEPELIIADEPSSALDASVGARVVDLLDDLRERLGTAILFITHDIGIAARIAHRSQDRMAVMLGGRVVELGYAQQVLTAAGHPYTRALIAAEPSARTPRGQLAVVPDAIRYARDWGELVDVAPGHAVALRHGAAEAGLSRAEVTG